ncbi:MAG TPA: TIM barrel protein, partial [Chloroflexota bacterium]|nr:TIM barrel protein [Chloroflexota bacterium]
MRLGINLMAWSGTIGPDELALLPRIASLGYDGVELPIFAPEQIDAVAVRRACESHGLHCTVSTAMPRGASLLDPAEQDAGVSFLERCAATAAACGARIVCGPLYSPVGHLPGRPRTDSEWEHAVDGLRQAG